MFTKNTKGRRVTIFRYHNLDIWWQAAPLNKSLQSNYPHANGEHLLKQIPHIQFLPISAMILLVVSSANGNGSALTSKASSKVKWLNNDTYRWNCAIIIMSSFGQIEQYVH